MSDEPSPFGCCAPCADPLSPAEQLVLEQEIAALQTALAIEITDRIAAIATLSQSSSDSNAAHDAINASVTNQITTITTQVSAFAQDIRTVQAQIGANNSSVQTITTAMTNLTNSVASQLTALTSTFNGNIATLTQSLQTLANDNSAQATLITALTSQVGGFQASLTTLSQTQQTDHDSLSRLITTITANVANANASLVHEQQVRAAANEALSSQVTALSASIGGGADFSSIISRLDAVVTQSGANATALQTLTTAFGGSTASLISQLQTTATLAGSTSTAITTLSAAFGGSTATLVSALTSTASAVTGLSLNYTLTADPGNGRISGIESVTNPDFSSFDILADRFSIHTPGFDSKVPFQVTADGLEVHNAIITGDGVVEGSLKAAKLETTSFLYNSLVPGNFFPAKISSSAPAASPISSSDIFLFARFNALDRATGYDVFRLGNTPKNMFFVRISGVTNCDAMNVWYRQTGDPTWIIFGAFGWAGSPIPANAYYPFSFFSQKEISIDSGRQIEFMVQGDQQPGRQVYNLIGMMEVTNY